MATNKLSLLTLKSILSLFNNCHKNLHITQFLVNESEPKSSIGNPQKLAGYGVTRTFIYCQWKYKMVQSLWKTGTFL